MRYTLTIFAGLALAGLFWTTPEINAQNSKEYKELQREFYETHNKLDEIRKAQDERIGQLETMLKQMMDANTKLVEQVQALQVKVGDAATQQERAIARPLDEVKRSVTDLWEIQQATKGAVDGVRTRQDNIEKGLTDLNGMLGLLREDLNTRTAPPSATTPSGSAAASVDAATIAFATAERDKLSGRLQQALDGFQSVATAYPASPEGPMAMYEIGMIYASVPQPEDAIKAFDRVMEQFGDNPMRKPAQFAKAEQLAAMGKRAEAAREFNNYARLYPDDDNTALAKQRATELTGPAPAKPNTNKGKRK